MGISELIAIGLTLAGIIGLLWLGINNNDK